MNCPGCTRETISTVWGDWCDTCGGVMIMTGSERRLFFRHVATVKGPGGIFPVVYDLSADAYGVAWPRNPALIRCAHCGKQTPVDAKHGLGVLDEIKQTGNYSKRGSLDAILAFTQPMARRESQEMVELSPAPSATVEERKLMNADA